MKFSFIITNILLIVCVTFPGASSAILLVAMMFIQNCRRALECIFVSVYSKSTMNIVHFLMGVILYSTFSLAVLSEAPGLHETKGRGQLSTEIVSGTMAIRWTAMICFTKYQISDNHQNINT